MNTEQPQLETLNPDYQIAPQSFGMNFTPKDSEIVNSLGEGTVLEPTQLEEISQEEINALMLAKNKFPQAFGDTKPYEGNIGNAQKPTKLPIEGRISQEYGVNVDYEASGKHGGIDIAIPTGTPIPELVGGKVLEAGKNGAWGNTVLIQGNDGITRRYSHLSSIDLKPGQDVSANTNIGLSGSTGRSSGPHLDYREYQSIGKQ
jgi:murein DD-endopeptidase MepM/ murein hydrolase activator NlpD